METISCLERQSLNSTLHRIYRLCGSPSDEDCWRRLHLGSSSTAVTQRPNPPHRRRVAEIFKDLLPPAALQLMEILLSLDRSR